MEIEVKDKRVGCLTLAMWFFLVFCTGMILICLGSCRSVKYVPYETIKRDSIYISLHQKDSIYLHDSIHVKEKGDTILIEKWRTKYVERQVHDTAYIERLDSVYVPYPVEKELSKWEKRYISLGKVSLGLYIGLVIALIAWLVYYIKRKKKLP